MSLKTRVMARALGLPPAETHDVVVERDLRIPMPDGVVLLADRHHPRGLGRRPTVLVRSVYTNRTRGAVVCEVIAERGFNVVVVSGRAPLAQVVNSIPSGRSTTTAARCSHGWNASRGSPASSGRQEPATWDTRSGPSRARPGPHCAPWRRGSWAPTPAA